MFDERRLQHHIDWPLLTAVLALAIIGLVMIYSATWNPLGGPDHAGAVGPRFWTHLYAFGIGVGALFTCLFLDYRRLCENSLFIYLGVAALLIYVLVAGSTQGGAQRWISVGSFNLQPSEFMKIALALALATYFAENNRGAQN
jgi:cell division protein FtsW (lipid II flippase)